MRKNAHLGLLIAGFLLLAISISLLTGHLQQVIKFTDPLAEMFCFMITAGAGGSIILSSFTHQDK
jgi:hypothetical protein